MTKLTHFNQQGEAQMVNVAGKASTHRVAIATGHITMQPATLRLITEGKHKKGDVLGVARIAGMMAAKRTADLIPLCHPLALSHVDIQLDCDPEAHAVRCTVRVETQGQTGVEMEALTAVQLSLLTIYDMCKAVDRSMTMEAIQLCHKSGGKSGTWNRAAEQESTG